MKSNLRDYILVLENVVPLDLCDEIIEEYKNDKNWVNTTTRGGLKRDIRRCDAIHITDQKIIEQNQERRKSLDDKMFNCAAASIKSYSDNFSHAKIEGDSGYTLLRYQEGEFYSQHTDHFLQAPRVVSCSFALNDGYEGGEFAFFDRNLVYKLPKGSALMFPSNFMYPHEVIPVVRGVRYSIITWFI